MAVGCWTLNRIKLGVARGNSEEGTAVALLREAGVKIETVTANNFKTDITLLPMADKLEPIHSG